MCEADAGARGRGPVGKRERARRVVWLCCTEIDYYVRWPLCTNHAGVTIQSPQVDINTVVAGVGTRFLFHNGGRGAEASLISPTGTRSVSLSYYYTLCTFGIPDKDSPCDDQRNFFSGSLVPDYFPPAGGRLAEEIDASMEGERNHSMRLCIGEYAWYWNNESLMIDS